MSIDYPSADDLDTGHASETSGYRLSLYLIPAAESDTDRPQVVTHGGYGNPGVPMPAWHGRWAHLVTVKPMIVGDALLRALQCVESELIALSDRYLGFRWDGSNHVGEWAEEEGAPCDVISEEIKRELSQDMQSDYWECGDWLVDHRTWPALAELADIDPARLLADSTRAAAIDAVVAAIESCADDEQIHVRGVREYVEAIVDEYEPEDREAANG